MIGSHSEINIRTEDICGDGSRDVALDQSSVSAAAVPGAVVGRTHSLRFDSVHESRGVVRHSSHSRLRLPRATQQSPPLATRAQLHAPLGPPGLPRSVPNTP